MDSTSASLLIRLQHPNEREAWDRFVRLYSPLMFHWARRVGMQAQDAADLVQDVLLALLHKLPEFRYDKQRSFRSWLRTVTMNQWRDRAKRRATRAVPGNDAQLGDVVGECPLDQLIETEYRQAVTGRALRLMQGEFQPRIWQACWQHTVEGRSAADVAAELGMTPGAVYAATCRVLGRLRQELDGLVD